MRPSRNPASSLNGRSVSRVLIILALAAATAGCVSFGGKAPPRLLTIASDAKAPAGVTSTTPSASAIFVDQPSVPKALATPRVAVRESSTAFAYVKDAIWVDLPARQFQSLLAETIRVRSNRLVLDPDQYLASSGHILKGNLTEFGVDASTNQAVVTYDASIRSPNGETVTHQRFTASVPIGKVGADTVASPINQAANQVAIAVADWIKTQP